MVQNTKKVLNNFQREIQICRLLDMNVLLDKYSTQT